MSAKALQRPEEPGDGGGKGQHQTSTESEWRKAPQPKHPDKEASEGKTWARNANLPMSLASIGRLESLPETPHRDQMCPVYYVEGSFSPLCLVGDAMSLPMVRPKRSHTGFWPESRLFNIYKCFVCTVFHFVAFTVSKHDSRTTFTMNDILFHAMKS